MVRKSLILMKIKALLFLLWLCLSGVVVVDFLVAAPRGAAQDQPQNASDLTARIQRIENGLLPTAVIKGQPSSR